MDLVGEVSSFAFAAECSIHQDNSYIYLSLVVVPVMVVEPPPHLHILHL